MKKRVIITQLDKYDCAAACLASIASFYGLNIPITTIRRKCGTTTKGTNIKGLMEAASFLNMEAKSYKISTPCYTFKSLLEIPVPSILHFKNSEGWLHFVVLYKVDSKGIKIMDPSNGEMRVISIDEFRESWTGYIITIHPTIRFEKGDKTTPFFKRVFTLLNYHKREIVPSMVGALIYVIIGISTSLFLQYSIDYIIPNRDFGMLTWGAIGIILLLGLSAFIGYIRTLLIIRGGIFIDASLIMGYTKHLLSLPILFFKGRSTGDINSRINDVYKIRSFISSRLIITFVSSFTLIIAVVLLFIFNWKMALISLSFIPFYCLLYYYANKVNKKHNKRVIEAAASFDNSTIELISSPEIFKYYPNKDFFFHRVEERYSNMAQKIYSAGRKGASISLLSDIILNATNILIIIVGTRFVLSNDLSIGELVSFFSIMSFFTSPLTILIESNNDLNDAKIAANRVFEVLDEDVEESLERGLPIPKGGGDIRFEKVSFKYTGEMPLLENLSITFPKGKITTIIGENGSGKSTIASLLMRSYPTDSGTICLGSLPINEIKLKLWREYISIIPQGDCLFNGSVMENVVLGDNEPNIDKVIEICERVGMIDFIKKLPKGLHTVIGDRGETLSGGEKVKISLARALYRDPKILIMDEVTSSLDYTSVEKVFHLTRRLSKQGVTIINITHDKRFIKLSDNIIDLNLIKGKRIV